VWSCLGNTLSITDPLLQRNNYFSITIFLPTMYLVAIAWIYVALMMAVAEATNSNGTVLGAMVTFVIYGLVPVTIVMYLLGTPSRNKARKARERAEWVAQQNTMAGAVVAVDAAPAQDGSSVTQPDAGSHAPGAAQAGGVAPVGKEL
jgi:hypothetical protein